MGKFIDLTGRTYNYVYIKSRAENRRPHVVSWNCICLLCGKEFVADGRNIKSGMTKSCGCLRAINNHNRTFEDLTGRTYNSLYIESFYGTDKFGKNHWNARCLLCGNVIHPDTTCIKSGASKTCGCQRMENMKNAIMVDLTGKRSGMLTAKYSLGSKNGRVLWHCDCDCGGWCVTTENAFASGKITSCGCLKSRNERRISLWLDEHNIEYERQKTFDDCRNINPLRFDFYLPARNAVLEYDGEFHYMEIDGIPNDYKQQQINDRIKDEYCKDHGIEILRIPYWEKDNIESILSDWLFLNDAEEANSSGVDLSA